MKKVKSPKKVGEKQNSYEYDYLDDLKFWFDSLDSC